MSPLTRFPRPAALALLTTLAAALVTTARSGPARSAASLTPVRSALVSGFIPSAIARQEGGPSAFTTRGRSYVCRVTPGGAELLLQPPSGTSAMVSMSLLGGNQHAVGRGEGAAAGVVNDLRGKDPARWRRGVRPHQQVRYSGVYRGIDLVYHRATGRLEYDFILSPQADPALIRLRFQGADGVSLQPDGSLSLNTPAGEVRQLPPIAFQVLDGRRRPVRCGYSLTPGANSSRVSFLLGEYDRTKPLVIDPAISYSRVVGGTDADRAAAVCVDAAGSAYLVGSTLSDDFPTEDPLQPDLASAGKHDVFIAKLNPAGNALEYATYLGGEGDDTAAGAVLAPSGALWLTGATDSADFPTQNPLPGAPPSGQNAFIARLAADGGSLEFSAQLGGAQEDGAAAIARGSDNAVRIVGSTASADFPTLNPLQAATAGGRDAFLVRISDTDTLALSTYLGGERDDAALGVAVAADGSDLLCGITDSVSFPTTAGAFQRGRSGSDQFRDAFVARVHPDGSGLVYGTYLGGLFDDTAWGIACDSAGSAYVTGSTGSPNFPTTPGAFQTRATDGLDAFITRFLPDGSALQFSTRLGGSSDENLAGGAITLDGAGNTLVAGSTTSTDFPVVEPVQRNRSGGTDAFVALMNPTGSVPIFSTYLGGPGEDAAFACALGPGPAAFAGGLTTRAVTPFPAQAEAATDNAFVTKITLPASELEAPDQLLAQAVAGNRVELTWRDNSDGEQSFEVQRKPGLPSAGGEFAPIGTTPADAESFADTTTEALTPYTYRVRAVDAERVSEFSNIVGVTTPEENASGPNAPTNLRAVPTGRDTVSLRWEDNSDNEASFRIERSTDAGATFAEIATLNPNSLRFTDTKLTHTTTYRYRVRAANSLGFSEYSNTSTASTYPVLLDLRVAGKLLRPGTRAAADVTLTGPATGGGLPVSLYSSNKKVATVPKSIRVRGGSPGANFTVRTKKPRFTTTVTISARMGGVLKQVRVQVRGRGGP